MRIEIHFTGGSTWAIDDASRSIETATDRELSDSAFYADARIGEHMEMDCSGGGEYDCPHCRHAREAIAEVRAERDRRDRVGIEQIVDLDEPTFEERYAPYGLAWQDEQRERREEGY